MKTKLFTFLFFGHFFLFIHTLKAQIAAMPFNVAQENFELITGTELTFTNSGHYINNIPIGFNFQFDGATIQNIAIAEGGYVSLNPLTPSAMNFLYTPKILYAFDGARKLNYNASVQYRLIGNSPNRIFVVQWLHLSNNQNKLRDYSFQIRLYETSNCIKFIYDSMINCNREASLGITGNTVADKILLENNTCDLLNTTIASVSNPTPKVKFCIPYTNNSGVAFNLGNPSGFTSHTGSYISGKVFNDINNNGIIDNNEVGIANNKITVTADSSYQIVTDENGDYSFFFQDSSLTYTLTTNDYTFWNNYNPQTITVNPSNQACSGVNIGLQYAHLPKVNEMPFSIQQDSFHIITGTNVGAYMYDCNGNSLGGTYHTNIPIGFDFNYNGSMHDSLCVASGGYIVLDHPTLPNNTIEQVIFNVSSNGTTQTPSNTIAALAGRTLVETSPNASLQYSTIGTAPNRVFIIQWLHYSLAVDCADLNFQIQLYEASGTVRLVYGTLATSAGSYFPARVGIQGTSYNDVKVVTHDTLCPCTNYYFLDSCATGFPSCNMANAIEDTARWHYFPPYSNLTEGSSPSLVVGQFKTLGVFSAPTPGLTYTFGSIPNSPFIGTGYITGKVFNDLNSNGIYDANEAGLPYRIVHIMPGNSNVTTDASGNYVYFFTDSSQTYTLSCNVANWNQTSLPLIWNCTPSLQACAGVNFGFHAIPNVHDMAIYCPTWCANPIWFWQSNIFYHNNGTVVESDSISMQLDPLYNYFGSSPSPIGQSGNDLKWAFNNLQPMDYGMIELGIQLDASAVIGNYVNSTCAVGPINIDVNPTDNTVNLHQLITGAWDPNDMIADPSGMIPQNTTINYTIRFQNTGNAAANNVFIYDTLDANLDGQTFQLIGATHPLTYHMDQNGVVKFSFYNIQLPDSGADFAGSNGLLTYSIKVKDNLTPLTVINGKAGIVFDFNAPVITNTVADTIQLVTGISSISLNKWKVFPNPSNGNKIHLVTSNLKDKGQLKITTIDGRVISEINSVNANESIDIASLAEGIYILSITSEYGIQNIKFIKKNN